MKKFYTGKGDDGKTGILGEGRVDKFDLRMEALGALDELSATLGLARSMQDDPNIDQRIVSIQRKLYELMAEVAASPENAGICPSSVFSSVVLPRPLTPRSATFLPRSSDNATGRVRGSS